MFKINTNLENDVEINEKNSFRYFKPDLRTLRLNLEAKLGTELFYEINIINN